MDVASTAAAAQTSATGSGLKLAEDFDTFLTLLTAQLENQDPLEPTDATEFTNQLVQFAGVEQQIQTNTNLADLIAMSTNSTAAGLSGYLGRMAEIDSPTAKLTEEGINWRYDLPEGVEEAIVSVKSEETGQIVYSQALSDTSAGERSFDWDGTFSDGKNAQSGTYSLVIRAAGEAEQPIDVSPRVRAEVTGVDLSGASTQISTNTGNYNFETVLRLIAGS